MSQSEAPKNTLPIPKAQVLAGFVLPALGHIMQKRYKRAAIFAASIYGMFIAGMVISNMSAIDPEHHPVYWWLTQFSAGLPAWVVHWGGLSKPPLIGETLSVSEQMAGLSYVCVAGLANILSLIELIKHNPELATTEAKA